MPCLMPGSKTRVWQGRTDHRAASPPPVDGRRGRREHIRGRAAHQFISHRHGDSPHPRLRSRISVESKLDEATGQYPGAFLARQCSTSPRLSRYTLVYARPSSAFSDDHRIRCHDALETSGQIRRRAHHPAFMDLPRADDVAYHDQPGGNANGDLQAALGRATCKPPRSMSAPPGPRSASSSWACGNRAPVPHILGNESVEPSDRLRDALVIGMDHSAYVLRVELCRKRNRADEVGEHNGQLAALASSRPVGSVSTGAVDAVAATEASPKSRTDRSI